jgi:hypothetical protein
VKAFIAQHHSLLPRTPAGWLLATIAEDAHGNVWAVAAYGRATARHLDEPHVAELARLCARSGAPRNTCTWLLGASRAHLRALYPRITRLISYQDCTAHTGAVYRADNWTLERPCRDARGRTWANRPGRTTNERALRALWSRTP